MIFVRASENLKYERRLITMIEEMMDVESGNDLKGWIHIWLSNIFLENPFDTTGFEGSTSIGILIKI